MTRRSFMLAAGAGAVGVAATAARAAEVPRPAPELVIRGVSGQQTLLSSFKGKVIALEFLHTTCPHCQNCSAILQRMFREYGPKGFQPVGVAFNDMASLLVPDYVKQLGLTFPIGVAPRDEVLTYLQHPVVERFYVPQLLFIDKKFVIRGQYSGDNDWFRNEEANMRSTIEMLLKEPAGAAKSRPAKPRAKKTATSASR